jgi:histidinol-phosphatase (PHP family)
MRQYWDHHARNDLDAYVETATAAKRAGLPVVVGLEVDYYRDRMDRVAELLDGYPFDVLLGSVHWIGAWRFDDLGDPLHMAEWPVRRVDACWDAYATAIEELAASGACDVLAHPDLVKVAGYVPAQPEECWDRLAEAAASSGMAAEVSSAGWNKTCREQYPSRGLLARLAERGVGFTTASDAHGLERVADRTDDLRELLASTGWSRSKAGGPARCRSRRPRRPARRRDTASRWPPRPSWPSCTTCSTPTSSRTSSDSWVRGPCCRTCRSPTWSSWCRSRNAPRRTRRPR